MSTDPNKATDEGTSFKVQPTKPTPPTKRFLEQPSSPALSLPIFPSTSTTSSLALPPKLNASPPRLLSPPKLVKYPTIVLTPVDPKQYSERGIKLCVEKASSSNAHPEAGKSKPAPLPPPPPLIKMPITTRNEKRSVVVKSKYGEVSDGIGGIIPIEPPIKRRRRENSESSSSTVTTTSVSAPATPRKIIQEIFGPDKSKKSKGKGRKRRRGVVSPKKKTLVDPELPVKHIKRFDIKSEENIEDVKTTEEHEEVREESEIAQHQLVDEEATDDEEDEIIPSNLSEPSQQVAASEPSSPSHPDDEVKSEPTDEASQSQDTKEEEDGDHAITQDTGIDSVDCEIEIPSEVGGPLYRSKSRRRAKLVANEKLKKINENQQDDPSGDGEERSSVEKKSDDISHSTKERGGIRSRRSTTEGSSGSSAGHVDSEGSGNGNGNDFKNKNLVVDREANNLTPLSIISEDDDHDAKEVAEGVSVSDIQEQKDSDVDSTYSWKPVRAAAAVALEQVTKKQGSGNGSTVSSTTAADTEAKASAAADRRARKIMRYKGRSRRTLLFKSSNSKKHTKVRLNKYSAQPTIVPKVFHAGHYFQPGDVVFVELDDGSPFYGQIRGLLMDHFGEISAGIRWLLPKHPIYTSSDFAPLNYAFRYDIPEKLVKMDFVRFVMHLNLDFFEGHNSYGKIEKGSIYTRMGKPLHTCDNLLADKEFVDGSETSCSDSINFEENVVDYDNSSDNTEAQDKDKKTDKSKTGQFNGEKQVLLECGSLAGSVTQQRRQ